MAVGLSQSQNIKQSQQLTVTPQLQQALKILAVTRSELETLLENELQSNPCLEAQEANADIDPTHSDAGDDSYESGSEQFQELISNTLSAKDSGERGDAAQEPGQPASDEHFEEMFSKLQESVAPGEEHYTSLPQEGCEEHSNLLEKLISSDSSDLRSHLDEQLRMMHLTPYELECTQSVIDYLDEKGRFVTTTEELAQEKGVPVEDINYALEVVQECEPIGVAARDLKECLVLQARFLLEHDSDFAIKILQNCWDAFQKQDVAAVAKLLNTSKERVTKALKCIQTKLRPWPGREYADFRATYITPDVYIFKRKDEWVVSLNSDGLPRLRLSPEYETLFDQLKNMSKEEVDKNLKKYMNVNRKAAQALIRALEERNKTILRVAEAILERQKDFFEGGKQHLRPLILKDIADELGLHESTVSRSTNGKYMHTPLGLLEFKYFFSQAVGGNSSSSGTSATNETIKEWISEFITQEKPEKPFSDQALSEMLLEQKQVKVARRTVAKYREQLGVLPSSKRKKRF